MTTIALIIATIALLGLYELNRRSRKQLALVMESCRELAKCSESIAQAHVDLTRCVEQLTEGVLLVATKLNEQALPQDKEKKDPL